MKKIFTLLIFLSSFIFSAIDDCKTDVYFGNGILTEEETAENNAKLLSVSIKKKFYNGKTPEMKKHIGKVDYAYNSTEGAVGDLLESLAQKLEGSIISYLSFVSQFSLLINNITAESQNSDIRLQVAKYSASIKEGNKVLLVAHSQGNLFGRKALITLTQNPKDFWMGNYFEAVSVASPMIADIKSDTPRIDWDNDIVSAIALGIGGGSVDNPVRYLKWDALRPEIGLTPREKRPDAHAWESQIGGLSHGGDWKSSNGFFSDNPTFGLSSIVHAFTFYMGEPLADKNYFDNTEMVSNDARVKIMSAISTKLNNGKQCPCSKGTKEPIETQNGAIEVTLSWTCGNNIDMDLLLSGPNVQVDVNDGDSDYMEHAYVATQAEIKPGDKFVALGRGEKKPESDLDNSALEDNPISLYAVVKTPGGSKFKQYEVKTFEQLNLGEFAEIEVKDNRRYETVVNDGGYTNPDRPQPVPNPRPYVRPYNECDDEDKKHTCGCVPCEYIIHGMDGAVEYGPIGGADVEVIRADTYGSATQTVVYRGKTTNENDIFKSGLVKFTQSDYDKFEDDVYYIVDAKGGSDLDRNDDLVKDDTPTPNNGTIHAIISGADLKTVAFRVNALTEAIYQTNGDLLGGGYDTTKLDERLAQASKKLFREKTFIFNNELEINYHDVLLWAPGVDKKKLFKPYDTFVEPIVVKTYADEPRVKESYRLIYEKLDTNAPQLAPLALEIPHTIPNGSIIGKVAIESEGVSGIDDIELHGDVNSSFSIDKEGLVKVVDNSGFIIDALYKLDMTAVGVDGKRSIGMELVVKVIEGVPLADPNATVPTLESVVLQDIIENSVGGTVVGQANFVDSSLNIVSYILSGEDNSSFSIDNTGEITVANDADIDYEKSDTYTVKVSAINEAGNESFPVSLIFKIINEIDTPLHDLVYLTHLWENVPIGTVVGKIVQLREGRSPIISFDILNPDVPFALDVNGTIRTTGYINYEDVDEYNLLAIAKTNSGNGNKVEIQILIDDVYPETGKPTMQPFSANIDENTNSGVEVGQLSISQGESAVERIELRGTGHSNFTVDVNGTIRVASAASLDYEQKSAYSLQAIAHNANGSSDLVSVNIALSNVEDEAPTLRSLTKSIEENATVNTVVGTLRLASNGEGNITDYALTGTGSENFSIDENGTISVSSSLDYETTPSYTLQATVMSDAGESNAVVVRIFILNVPEFVPMLNSLSVSVDERTGAGTMVGTVKVESVGDTPIYEYILNGEGKDFFVIDRIGTVSVSDTAVFDASVKDTYALSAVAMNQAGSSNAVDVKIKIIPPDTEKPGIALMGSSHVQVIQGRQYIDMGANAYDAVDGDISYNIVVDNPVNTSFPVGTIFTVHYNVSDLAGNSAKTVTRTVEIVRDLNINLTEWKANGTGNWVLQTDHRTILQTLNADPTIYHNNVASQSDIFELRGEIRVKTSSDDDFIGFVLGYKDGNLNKDDVNYLLIDWKQGDQGGGKKGLSISRITKKLTPGAWSHDPSKGVTELQRGASLGNVGWKDNTSYIFRITFTSSLVEVFINDVKELSITGEFSDGAYGFYNYSQESVLYSAIRAEANTNSPPTANAGIDQNITVGTEVILDGTGSTDDVGIASYLWQEENNILSYDSKFIIDDLPLGLHTLTLTVEDDEGENDSDELVVIVKEEL